MQRVLSVGNCDYDHGHLRRLLLAHFTCEVVQAHGADDALAELTGRGADLVLVNRLFDRGGEGLAFIEKLKGLPESAGAPVMLLSNMPDQQSRAVELGALPGFGKSALGASDTLAKLRAVLGKGKTAAAG